MVHNNGAAIIASGKRVRLSGVGKVKVRLHRPLEGTVKQISVTKTGYGHWYISFICVDVPKRDIPLTNEAVGIDLGISSFAALSNNELIDNPRFQESAEKEVAKSQRRVSCRKRRSNRRRKAVEILAKARARERRRREDFQHKVALDIIRRFDVVAVEDLNIRGLAKGWLSKQVHDVAWGSFIKILEDKAESAGRTVIKVDPRGTSQECSSCGNEVKKGLRVRTHKCLNCGLVLDRDINAARVIFSRAGLALRGGCYSV